MNKIITVLAIIIVAATVGFFALYKPGDVPRGELTEDADAVPSPADSFTEISFEDLLGDIFKTQDSGKKLSQEELSKVSFLFLAGEKADVTVKLKRAGDVDQLLSDFEKGEFELASRDDAKGTVRGAANQAGFLKLMLHPAVLFITPNQ